jgi:hypothetical protein
VGADKPDIDDTVGIVDADHQAITVAGDVEHHTVIRQETGRVKLPFSAASL